MQEKQHSDILNEIYKSSRIDPIRVFKAKADHRALGVACAAELSLM
jgi:hypothetical protein